MENAVATAT